MPLFSFHSLRVFRHTVGLLLVACVLALPANAQERAIGVESAYTTPVSEQAPAGNAGLFVGINTFTDDRGIRPLKYAVNDAVAQAHLFVIELRLIPPANAFLALAGEPSTDDARQQLAALRAAGVERIAGRKTSVLRQLLLVEKLPAAASDLVVVSISSHGFEEGGTAYAMPTDGLRGILGDTAINLGTVETRLARSKAGKRLLILDACRERPSGDGKGGDLPMTAAFRGALANARGQAVLASCDAGQLSYENDQLGHGVFTYFLLQALRGQAEADAAGHITLGSVSDHVSAQARDWAVRHRPGLEASKVQRPWFKGPNDARDIPLALRESGPRPGDIPTLPAPVLPVKSGLGGEVLVLLSKLDSLDKQIEQALESYLPNSTIVTRLRKDRTEAFREATPVLLAARKRKGEEVERLVKEMRSDADPIVQAKEDLLIIVAWLSRIAADPLLQHAQNLSQSNQGRDAVALAIQAERRSPGNKEATMLRSRHAEHDPGNELDAAVSLIQRPGGGLSMNWDELAIAMAEARFWEGGIDAALDRVRQTIGYQTKARAMVVIAEAQIRSNDTAGATESLLRALGFAQLREYVVGAHGGEVETFVAIAEAQFRAEDMAGTASTLEQARSVAHMIPNANDKALALASVARAQIRMTSKDDAVITCKQALSFAGTDEDRFAGVRNVEALIAVAEAQNQAGDLAGAGSTCERALAIGSSTPEDEPSRAAALGAIAMAQAGAGDAVGSDKTIRLALSFIKLEKYDFHRAEALTIVAIALAMAGDVAFAKQLLEAALEVSKRISSNRVRAGRRVDIATAQVIAGDMEAGWATVDLINTRDVRDIADEAYGAMSKALAEAGDFRNARVSANRIRTRSDSHDSAAAMGLIAKEQARRGEIEAARETLNSSFNRIGTLGAREGWKAIALAEVEAAALACEKIVRRGEELVMQIEGGRKGE